MLRLLFTILFVGSHPDDIELGCGGSIRRFLDAGYRVLCIYLTRGERGGPPDVRTRESLEACRRLGVETRNVVFGPFPDTRIPGTYEVIRWLEGFADRQVSAVFAPSARDTHQDHRHTGECCLTAFRNVPSLFAYESPSTIDFSPKTYVDITGCLRQKWAALRCHRSQLARKKMYLEYRSMLRLAAFRGRQAGVTFAEAFETIRHRLELPDLNRR